jgi:hypothetical protein
VYCFGDNDDSQLGISASNEAQAATGSAWLPANEGVTQTAAASSIAGITAFNELAVGLDFTCAAYTAAAASASGNIACWGNEGDLVNASTPQLLNWQAQAPSVPTPPRCPYLLVKCQPGFGNACVPSTSGCCLDQCEPMAACSLSTSSGACPPGEYANPQVVTGSNPGCSFTAPNLCTSGSPTAIAPVATQLAVGANAVYAIGVPVGATNTAAVYAWGDNSFYQLGDGTTASSTLVSAPTVPLFVAGNAVTQIAAGDSDACGLLQESPAGRLGPLLG